MLKIVADALGTGVEAGAHGLEAPGIGHDAEEDDQSNEGEE